MSRNRIRKIRAVPASDIDPRNPEDASKVMAAPLGDWINRWLYEGAQGTCEVFRDPAQSRDQRDVVLFAYILPRTAEELAEWLATALAALVADGLLAQARRVTHPAKPKPAPSSNTGPNGDVPQHEKGRIWPGFDPIGHIPPGAGDN